MGGIEPLAPCVLCSRRGKRRLATFALHPLSGDDIPVCDICHAAFPLPLRLGAHGFTELPWADEARRLNKVKDTKEVAYDKLNRPTDR